MRPSKPSVKVDVTGDKYCVPLSQLTPFDPRPYPEWFHPFWLPGWEWRSRLIPKSHSVFRLNKTDWHKHARSPYLRAHWKAWTMSVIDVKKVKILAVHHYHTYTSKKPWRNMVRPRRSGRPRRGWEAAPNSNQPQQFAQSPLRSV